ncbi:MAG: PEP/pyruvate-binding domain-containing protein [Actinomycetota bacterium]
MSGRPAIPDLSRPLDARRHGGKAANLHRLVALGYPVPAARVVDVAVLADPHALDLSWVDPARAYAVRSSASVEDGAERSFAGQFATVLDVRGEAAVRDALRAVAASAHAARVVAYAGEAPTRAVAMAAIVQDLVPAVAGGVAFSRNPVTGIEEVVIEGVAGSGEALVGEGRTPARWVDRFGAITERPSIDAPLPDEVVLRLAHDVRRIAESFGRPVDVEWVWDGAQIWWVQVRPITVLHDVPLFSNRISREVMPGMIRPLVWSLNTGIVNRAWMRIIRRLIGRSDLRPEDLARSFAFRSYFDMGVFGRIFASFGMPRQSMEQIVGLPTGSDRPRMRPSTGAAIRNLPRLLALAVTALRFPRTSGRALRRLERALGPIRAVDPAGLDARALLARVEALSAVLERYALLNIYGPFIQLAWNGALRRGAGEGEPSSLDPGADDPRRRAVDPAVAIADLAALAADLGLLDRLRSGGADAVTEPAWRDAWSGFLDRFGHLSDRPNDCSAASWREEPMVPLGLVLGHVERPRVAARHPLEGSRAWRRAARARVDREVIGAGYARAYALLRPTALALGERLVAAGAIAERDDVFFLDLDEVRGLVAGDAADVRARIAERRRSFEDLRDLEMPELIVGDDFVPRRPADGARVLRGVATSAGRRSGSVRVIRSLREGDALLEGEVLVLAASDVTWTPLFSRASAVVTESGGTLAHASIVARELGIPCVASVTGATALADGTRVIVDGYAGEVLVEG